MTQVNVKEALQAARAKGQPATLSVADLPTGVPEAYAQSIGQMQKVAAWKIGGANPWSRAVFDNTEVFFGPLHPSEVFLDTATVSLKGLVAPLAEPEVMLELGDWTAADPAARFTRIGLGFEIPASVLPDALKPELTGQIVDRAGAGALWISAVKEVTAEALNAAVSVRLLQNDQPPVEGHSDNVIGGVLGAVTEFLDLAQQYDMPLARGQWVATGGLCPAVSVAPGDQLVLQAGAERLHLGFE